MLWTYGWNSFIIINITIIIIIIIIIIYLHAVNQFSAEEHSQTNVFPSGVHQRI